MSIIALILKEFAGRGFTVDELYAAFPLLNRSSIRTALWRAKKKGIIKAGRKKAAYTSKGGWRRFRHAKRMVDTNKRRPAPGRDKIHRIYSDAERRNEFDLELTCEGYAPEYMSMDDIEALINPLLVQRGMEIIQNELGVFIIDADAGWRVVGSEWRRGKKAELDIEWKIEAQLINLQGRVYSVKDSFQVVQDMWDKPRGRWT